MAVYVTALPFTVAFTAKGFHGLLFEDWSERIFLAVIAIALWTAYARVSRGPIPV